LSAYGSNLFAQAQNISSLDLVNNYAEISGCPVYSESAQAFKGSSITLSKILNIGWAKDTMPFVFELYALSQNIKYKIAQVTQSDLVVRAATMLTLGSIKALGI
jgi:hypothetical protein